MDRQMDRAEQRFSFVPPHQRIFEWVLRDHVRAVPEEHMILDIGSGLGHWTNLVSGRWKHSVAGLEIDAVVCRMAAASTPSTSRTRFVLYDGYNFPFSDCSFELAYAHEVIEHVEHDLLFLTELERVLRPGGTLLITTPNASLEPLDPRAHAAHVRHYTAPQLRDKLQQAGLVPRALYWRMHPVCGFLDDQLTAIGRRTLDTHELQPGMSSWKPVEQRWWIRALLRLYKIAEPVLDTAVYVEFELLKRSVEARSMIMIARKQGKQEGAA
jgi:SAM-dependent methyltransferase